MAWVWKKQNETPGRGMDRKQARMKTGKTLTAAKSKEIKTGKVEFLRRHIDCEVTPGRLAGMEKPIKELG